MKSIPLFKQLITKKDEEVLEYLENIQIFNQKENDDYLVEFTFGENPFFENEKLMIKMVYDHDEDFEDDLVEIKGEMIEWKIG